MEKILRQNIYLPKRKNSSHVTANIDFYDLCHELICELEQINVINRLKDLPQLGVIRTAKKQRKSRFDYIVLQLHYHTIIEDVVKNERIHSYSLRVHPEDFLACSNIDATPTAGDIVRIFAFAYNIGHFYNTFAASQAVLLLSQKSLAFRDSLIGSSENSRYQECAKKILDMQNYHHLHLLNSLLILDRCKQIPSVIIAKELIYAYILADQLSSESRLHEIFKLFRKVRDIAFITYDLPVSSVPIGLDISNKEGMRYLFEELLTEYGNSHKAESLISGIQKFLQETLYNDRSKSISYFRISTLMVKHMLQELALPGFDYYKNAFLNKNSPLNRKYPCSTIHDNNILKITFPASLREETFSLIDKLIRMQGVCVGYYDRHSYHTHEKERTILISIAQHCKTPQKTALRVVQACISCLQKCPGIIPSDARFLLIAKFFLHHLLGAEQIKIESTIGKSICCICTRGKCNRIVELDKLLRKKQGDDAQRHEAEFMRTLLEGDSISDTSLLIPASIVLIKPEDGTTFAEFDGLIIHPLRKCGQVVFMEAKNTKKSAQAVAKLRKRLNKVQISCSDDKIVSVGRDAYYVASI